MSDFVWPHRRQPTRLAHPWDSPGKNTGVGCHFLLQCRKVKSESEFAQSCPTLSDPMDCSLPGSSVHGIFQARVLEWGARTYSPAKLNLSLTTLSNVFHPTYALHYPVSFIILYTVGNYLIYLRSVPCLSEWKSHEKKDFSLFSAEYPGTRTVFVTQYVLYKYL